MNSSNLTSIAMPSARFACNEGGDVVAGDQMDVDVLMLGAAALADLAQAVRANQREAFRAAGPARTWNSPSTFDPLGGVAGLFLQLLDRRFFDRRVRVLVADQAGGKLEAALADRHAILVDEDDLALMLGDDDDGVHAAACARHIPSGRA